ncbi:hypothetical protein SLA2020_084790 [Shorea laevis]
MADEVVLLNFWPSAFGMRVKIALAEKGIKIIHNGKSVCESLIQVQYIDEVWKGNAPFLPSDPYARSQAKFWGDFVDKKIYAPVWNVLMTKGDEQAAAKKELIESLKLLEAELGDKTYFGGSNLGYVDVALVSFCIWFYAYEKCGNFSIEAESLRIVLELKKVSGAG